MKYNNVKNYNATASTNNNNNNNNNNVCARGNGLAMGLIIRHTTWTAPVPKLPSTGSESTEGPLALTAASCLMCRHWAVPWSVRVDVMQLLLLLGLAVLVFLHFTCILHIGPVGRQHHQVVDLKQHHTALIAAIESQLKLCIYIIMKHLSI